MSKKFVNPASFMMPLNINGMDGRLMRLESTNRHNKREILLIYDLQSNIEKWWGLAVVLKKYGNVTLVDLPGFGGMDSFYTIGLKPTINNMADYVASFIKLKFKRKRLSVVGVGFGSVVLTRMMQRNPDIDNKINLAIYINGYAHSDDFAMKKFNRQIMRAYSSIGSLRLFGQILSMTMHNGMVLSALYPLSKFKTSRNGPSREFIRRFKIDLIMATDFRTSMFLNRELLKLDNCRSRIKRTVYHITTSNSGLNVSPKLVEQHFRVIYDKYYQLPAKVGRKMPLVLNDEKVAIRYLPAKVRRLLKAHA